MSGLTVAERLDRLDTMIDDTGSEARWPDVVARYARLARRWHVLSPRGWYVVQQRILAVCVREAMGATDDPSVLRLCEATAGRCDRRADSGESIGDEAAWAADRVIVATLDALEAEIARSEAA